MFEFAAIYNLIWLIPLFILFLLAIKRKPATIKFSADFLLKKSGAVKFSLRRNLPTLFYSLAGIFIIIALSQPRLGSGIINSRTDGIDIILCIDVSGSMSFMDISSEINTQEKLNAAFNAGKIPPRIDVAKQELEKFVKSRPYDRIGLVAFAGLPQTICPPTLDHKFLLDKLKDISAGMYDQVAGGTGIAAPLSIATSSLKSSETKRRIIILFTDGANNINDVITPLQAAELAHKNNISVYTVAIGSHQYLVKQHSFFGQGNYSVQKDQFDKTLLQEIAKNTNGVFMEVEDYASFENAMNEINKLEKTTVIEQKYTIYKEYFQIIILFALIFLALGFITENSISQPIP